MTDLLPLSREPGDPSPAAMPTPPEPPGSATATTSPAARPAIDARPLVGPALPRKWLLIALVTAAAVRIPGVFWGDNFPGAFRGHHVDEWTHVVNSELLVDPQTPPRWHPNPYPKGMAAHVAIPVLIGRVVTGQPLTKPTSMELRDRYAPSERTLLFIGRGVNVVYGTLTVLIVWLLARRLLRREDVALVAAWFAALGGLHVSQSHFFLADVGAIFWFLLATWLLLRDLDEAGRHPLAYALAAAAMGASVGMKLYVVGLPALGLAALMRGPRLTRLVQGAAFFLAAFVGVNLLSYTPADILKTMTAGITGKDLLDPSGFPRIYGLELLASIGAPVALLALGGVGIALITALRSLTSRLAVNVLLCIALPACLHAGMLFFKLPGLGRFDPFPRHLLPLFPWLWILAAWAIGVIARQAKAEGRGILWLAVPVLLWQAGLVVDGEKGYVIEPRNEAMRWLSANAVKGSTLYWPAYEKDETTRLGLVAGKFFHEGGKPDTIVAEMYRVNHFLSGTGPRESYPRDYRRVFDGQSQQLLDAWQALFRGQAGYRRVTTFSENYWMPEFRLADRLLGNRSRNYLTELVIFKSG